MEPKPSIPAGSPLWPMVIGGAVLAAIPFLGGFMLLGLGGAAANLGNKQVRHGQKFLAGDDMTPLARAEVGDLDVVLTGTVVAESREHRTGRWRVANAVVRSAEVRRVRGNVGDFESMWSQVTVVPFGVTEGGVLALVSGSDPRVMASKSYTREWSGEAPDEIAECVGGLVLEPSRLVDGHLTDYDYEYLEWTIVPGDTIRVEGSMTGTADVEQDRAHYRDAGRQTRALINARQISNVVGESLDRTIKNGKSIRAMGAVYLLLSVVTTIAWASTFGLF